MTFNDFYAEYALQNWLGGSLSQSHVLFFSHFFPPGTQLAIATSSSKIEILII
jgi:hypothetical protein